MPRTEPARAPSAPARWPVVLAWALWTFAVLMGAVIVWLDQLMRQAGRADLVNLTPAVIPVALAFFTALTVGAVVATRRPRHPVGWLLMGYGMSAPVANSAAAYASYALFVRPDELPGARLAPVLGQALFDPGFACIGLVLLLTPTGSLPSPRWRWCALIMVAAAGVSALGVVFGSTPLPPPLESVPNPLAVSPLASPLAVVQIVAFNILVLTLLAAVVSMVVRFRRARGTERLQLRWIALGVALIPVAVLAVLASMLIDDPTVSNVVLYAAGPDLPSILIPVAISAAVLRYRLYDLDRIVSRTLAYGLLTVLLGLGYAVIVLGLGEVLGRVGGSSLAVAAATLAVAAAFQPARRRIQDLVDRRFNRRRYDAERTIAAFSGRLRQQTDLDALTTELLAVVDQTVQPTRAALWLRPAAERGGGGTRVQG